MDLYILTYYKLFGQRKPLSHTDANQLGNFPHHFEIIDSTTANRKYIYSPQTQKYLGRNSNNKLYFSSSKSANYCEWEITTTNGITTLKNLNPNKQEYLVYNPTTLALSFEATSDNGRFYVTESRPQSTTQKICVGNNGIYEVNEADVYLGANETKREVTIYIEQDDNDPIVQYNFENPNNDYFKYMGGNYGVKGNKVYLFLTYKLTRSKNTDNAEFELSYKTRWTHKSGKVTYFDNFNRVTFKVLPFISKTTTPKFTIPDVNIPIKNANITQYGKYEEVNVTPTIKDATQTTEFLFSTIKNSHIDLGKLTINNNNYKLTYNCYYEIGDSANVNNKLYNAYVGVTTAYLTENNNRYETTFRIMQDKNPLNDYFSSKDVNIILPQSGFSSHELDLPKEVASLSGRHVIYKDNDNIKLENFEDDEDYYGDKYIQIDTNSVNQSENIDVLKVGNYAKLDGDIYPYLVNLIKYEKLPIIYFNNKPFQYYKKEVNANFPHLENYKNEFVTLNVNKRKNVDEKFELINTYKTFVGNDNNLKISVEDIIAPIKLTMDVNTLNYQNDNFSLFYKFGGRFSQSSHYRIETDTLTMDLIEETRSINKTVQWLNRTFDYYVGCPYFLSCATTKSDSNRELIFNIGDKEVDSGFFDTTSNQVIGFNIIPIWHLEENASMYPDAKTVNITVKNDTEVSDKLIINQKDVCKVPYLIYYINHDGGVDIIPLNECIQQSLSVSSEQYTKKSVVGEVKKIGNYGTLDEYTYEDTNYSLEENVTYSCKTDLMDDYNLNLHKDLFSSMEVVLYDVVLRKFYNVNVTTTSYTIKTRKNNSNKPSNMTFNIKLKSSNNYFS